MITRIEIDGFKTFQDFAIDLEPFQVIIGPNGCGKSNFFDALDLLSKVATSDLRTAFKSIRGDINELFTVLPGGKSADRMRFAVEIFTYNVMNPIRNASGQGIGLPPLRMRYEVEIGRRTKSDMLEQLYIAHERLVALPSYQTSWKYNGFAAPAETSAEEEPIEWLKVVYEGESRKYVKFYGNDRRLDVTDFDENKSIINFGFILGPQALITQQQLSQLLLIRLNVEGLRSSSHFTDDPFLTATGANLPATLARMQTQDKPLMKNVSRDVSGIVPGFAGIEVDRDTGQKRVTLYANMQDKRRFSMEALSEGTLRILALATLRNDPQLQGTVCFEDPERGLHPGALPRIVRMLRSMATDFDSPNDLKMPLRQVLVTTHSPELVSHLNIDKGELLFASSATRVVPGGAAWRVTRIVPVCPDGEQGPEQTHALSNVIEYLNNPDAAEKQNSMREALLH